MPAAFNPFVRSQLKFEEPVRLVNRKFSATADTHTMTYHASRAALNSGVLDRQFSAGRTISIDGVTYVVVASTLKVDSENPANVELTVTARDFASILNLAKAGKTTGKPAVAPAPNTVPAEFLQAKKVTRKIIL